MIQVAVMKSIFFSLFEAMISFFSDWDMDELDKNVRTVG